MKFSIKLFSVLSIAIALLFGAAILGFTGIDSVHAYSSSDGNFIVDPINTVSYAGLDITAVTALLGAYVNVPKNVKDIWYKAYQQVELFQYMRKISGRQGSYTGVQAQLSGVLQAFQKSFTPAGDLTFTPYQNQIFRAKVDYLLDDLDELENTYLMFLMDETKERKDWPFVKYIIDEHLIPGLASDLNTALCRGVYVAPTNGVAGTVLGSMNGLQTIITNEITATNLVPIVTGAISSADAVTKIELFADGIDSYFSSKGGVILCSETVAKHYKRHYRSLYGSTNDKDSKNNLKLDDYEINLLPIKGWGSSQRLLFTPTGPKGNLLYLNDKITLPTKFEVQADKRDIILMTDFHSAPGFNTLDAVFVNDQA